MWPAMRTVLISTCETLAENDGGTGLKFAELATAHFLIMFLFTELSNLYCHLPSNSPIVSSDVASSDPLPNSLCIATGLFLLTEPLEVCI